MKEFLQANGLTCWMDQEGIGVGQDYAERIANALPKCRALVLLVSYVSQQSRDVKIEYEMARDNHLVIFPLAIEECTLSSYYAAEFKHIQVAVGYWKNIQNKQKILCSVRDAVYELKNEPPRSADDFLQMRVAYYQEQIRDVFRKQSEGWGQVIQKAVDRCGFMTPGPHFIRSIVAEEVLQYQTLVEAYTSDIVLNSSQESYLRECLNFILENDLITAIWYPYVPFCHETLKRLTYLTAYSEAEKEYFLLRVYKDYLNALQSSICKHPIGRICEKLAAADNIRYEMFLGQVLHSNNPSFVRQTSLAVFVDPRYMGTEYVNIQGRTKVDGHRAVFKPTEITWPCWIDFLLKYTCDRLMDELKEKPGASTLISFILDNSFFADDGNFHSPYHRRTLNYAYLYLIGRFIESGHPEYVKILLRNMGRVDWYEYIGEDTDREIALMKRFIFCCMVENGYEMEDIRKLWREA